MTRYRLGINTCFAVKRWPEAEVWSEIVRDRLGLSLVQHSFDLVDLSTSASYIREQAEEVRSSCATHGLDVHSTFTGLAAYSYNLLLHPNPQMRDAAETFFRNAIDFTAAAGGSATGGHIGAFSAASWGDPETLAGLRRELAVRLRRITAHARQQGLAAFLIENMTAGREPSTMVMIEELLTRGDPTHVPVELCLDIGHQCVAGAVNEERDPYAWLRRFGPRAPVIHLQQSDEQADHHWPFTPELNAWGRIRAERVLDALAGAGEREIALILEIIPPFEATDASVLRDLELSVEYWKDALQ